MMKNRNPDLPLRLLPGRRPDVSGIHEARPFAYYDVLRGLWCGSLCWKFLYVPMPIVWMYSFFDTFNLRAQIGAGTAPQDDYLVHINWHDQRMEQFMLDSHKLLGWGLIALGALVAYQNILMNTLGDIVWRWGQSSPFFRALYLMMDQLPEVVVCVALIICGAWLVRGPKGRKQKPQNDAEDEEFTEYTAQDAQAEPEARGFAMPKLSALLGKPVTPDDETEDADDGRDEK